MITRETSRDDRDILMEAANGVRAATGAEVVFGGFRSGRGIRVSATTGALTGSLTSILVHPAQGLGGRSWETRRPFVTADYARASEISHDFDPQILGEGIRQLAVVPIVVSSSVVGLLYAGRRTSVLPPLELEPLGRAARLLAQELRVRDLVDERLEEHRAAERLDHSYGQALAELREQVEAVAASTTDAETGARLRRLIAPAAPSDQAEPLTPRQRDVLTLVASGLNNAQIGARLGLSGLTVKSYLRTMMARFSSRTRHDAVIQARRLGLL